MLTMWSTIIEHSFQVPIVKDLCIMWIIIYICLAFTVSTFPTLYRILIIRMGKIRQHVCIPAINTDYTRKMALKKANWLEIIAWQLLCSTLIYCCVALCNLVQDAWAGLGWWPDVYSGESRWVAAWQESRNTLQASAVTVFSSCVRITITAASINTHMHSFCGISIDIKFSYVLYL